MNTIYDCDLPMSFHGTFKAFLNKGDEGFWQKLHAFMDLLGAVDAEGSILRTAREFPEHLLYAGEDKLL